MSRKIVGRTLDRFRRKSPPRRVGAAPGTLRIAEDATRPQLHLIRYDTETCERIDLSDVEQLGEYLGQERMLWINVNGLGDEKFLRAIGELLSIHPLALEDIVNVPQRPKVEVYEHQTLIVTRMVTLAKRVEIEQVSMVVGAGWVVTFQEHPGDCFDPVRTRLEEAVGRIRNEGADFLAYALLDAVIDAYFPVIEEFGERLEAMEQKVMAHPSDDVIRDIFAAKRDLLTLRRAIWPQREEVSTLVRDETPGFTDNTRVYLRDCYDHVVQLIDMVETDREIASGLLDAYHTIVANRMNEIMKVLTIIATIFIPLGFLAGVWGMNFNPDASPNNMPELSWRYGYPFALGLMATVAIGMLVIFWRLGWFRGDGNTVELDAPDSEGESK